MNPLDPNLRRLFALARFEEASPPSDLEERLLTSWREGSRPNRRDALGEFRLGVAGAAGVLMLTCVFAYKPLTSLPDPSVLLANAALRGGLAR